MKVQAGLYTQTILGSLELFAGRGGYLNSIPAGMLYIAPDNYYNADIGDAIDICICQLCIRNRSRNRSLKNFN